MKVVGSHGGHQISRCFFFLSSVIFSRIFVDPKKADLAQAAEATALAETAAVAAQQRSGNLVVK